MSPPAMPMRERAVASIERIMAECVARTRRNGALTREILALRARAFHQLADRWELVAGFAELDRLPPPASPGGSDEGPSVEGGER
jgi:hypothetical protein